MPPVHSFLSLIIYKASQVLKKPTALCCAALSGPGLLGGGRWWWQGAESPPTAASRLHFQAQDPQITQGGPGLQGRARSWGDREDAPERPSGPQESLGHKVEVPEGSLLAGGQGAAGVRRGQGRRQPRELALEVAQVCRATECGQERRPDGAGEQGLPVSGLGGQGESCLRRRTSAHAATPWLPLCQAPGTRHPAPLTLKKGWVLTSSASCSPAPRRCSGHFCRSWARRQGLTGGHLAPGTAHLPTFPK